MLVVFSQVFAFLGKLGLGFELLYFLALYSVFFALGFHHTYQVSFLVPSVAITASYVLGLLLYVLLYDPSSHFFGVRSPSPFPFIRYIANMTAPAAVSDLKPTTVSCVIRYVANLMSLR